MVVAIGFIAGSFIGYVFDFGYFFGLGGGGESNVDGELYASRFSIAL